MDHTSWDWTWLHVLVDYRNSLSVRLRHACLCSVLLLTACVPLLDDSCGPETRTTSIRADIPSTTGTRIGFVEVRLLEVRGDPEPRRLHAIFMGPSYGVRGPLSGHIQSARLLDRTGAVLRELPFRPGNEHEIIRAPGIIIADPAEFDDLRLRFLGGDVVIEIESDLTGLERLRIPLPVQHAGQWRRASCS